MQKSSIRKFSLLGLVLVAASAVTAAILPKNDSPRIFDGVQAASTGGDGNQKSCINVAGTKDCSITEGTFTTDGVGTSANRNSSFNNKHSSKSPE